MSDPQTILEYWLDTLPQSAWFVADPGVDATITQRFLGLWQAACDGEFSAWLDAPDSTLAYLILTDQFPRNMFRGQAKSFATDGIARAAARVALDKALDLRVKEPERVFFYLPFEHSEAAEDQALSVELMQTRLPEGGESFTLHARAHQDVIRRFGRFPFRNAALGRATTAEEQQFLDAGGYGATVRALGG